MCLYFEAHIDDLAYKEIHFSSVLITLTVIKQSILLNSVI